MVWHKDEGDYILTYSDRPKIDNTDPEPIAITDPEERKFYTYEDNSKEPREKVEASENYSGPRLSVETLEDQDELEEVKRELTPGIEENSSVQARKRMNHFDYL